MRSVKLLPLRIFYWTIIISLLVLYTLSITIFSEIDQKTLLKRRDCYEFSNDVNSRNLGDILNAEVKPSDGRSIFFLMTGCSENNVIILSASQSCAIESAAFHNPNRTVFILFASPVQIPTDSHSKTFDVLRSYSNIHFLNIDVETFVKGTPVDLFYQKGQLFTSRYFIEHMSDFLRLLVLYKYGGIYLDTDVIVQKNMDELPANFLGKEAYRGKKIISVNGAVIGFQDDFGHEILELCLRDMMKNFQPNDWGHNGPELFTRVLENHVCHTSLAEMTPERCRGFTVFPPEEFYAINWDDWSQFLNVRYTESVLDATKNSSAIHLWNHFWRNKIITKSKLKTAYEVIADKNCPNVFRASGRYF